MRSSVYLPSFSTVQSRLHTWTWWNLSPFCPRSLLCFSFNEINFWNIKIRHNTTNKNIYLNHSFMLCARRRPKNYLLLLSHELEAFTVVWRLVTLHILKSTHVIQTENRWIKLFYVLWKFYSICIYYRSFFIEDNSNLAVLKFLNKI